MAKNFKEMNEMLTKLIETLNEGYTYTNDAQLEEDMYSGKFVTATVQLLRSYNAHAEIDGVVVTYVDKNTGMPIGQVNVGQIMKEANPDPEIVEFDRIRNLRNIVDFKSLIKEAINKATWENGSRFTDWSGFVYWMKCQYNGYSIVRMNDDVTVSRDNAWLFGIKLDELWAN